MSVTIDVRARPCSSTRLVALSFFAGVTEVHMQPILAHAGGLDEFLLILALVGLPLLLLGFVARRVRPDDDEEDDEISR